MTSQDTPELVERVARAMGLRRLKTQIKDLGCAVPCDEYLLERLDLDDEDLADARAAIEAIQSYAQGRSTEDMLRAIDAALEPRR